MIASDGGRFTRIADLCAFFEHQLHLDRTNIEEILGELAANGYLQRHGFKNQYGADEKLHQLVDYRMIYGNFGAGSDLVTVHYKSKLLGEVPAINLLRARNGTSVRFAGKNWVVQRASRDGITVLPASSGRGAVDFVYPGKGPPTDAFVPNRMWQLLHESELPKIRSLPISWITYQPSGIIFAVAAAGSRFRVFHRMAVRFTLLLLAICPTRRWA